MRLWIVPSSHREILLRILVRCKIRCYKRRLRQHKTSSVYSESKSLNYPIDEQTEIVRRVEALLHFADHLEARHQAAYVQVEKLTSATLSKAFRGELVPQDPKGEPASKLLERIR